MRRMMAVALGVMGFAGLTMAAHAAEARRQAAPVTQTATYVDENSTDPAPLKLDGLSGQVQGLGGDPMPRATVSLFTEAGHSLVGSVMSDRKGNFKFDKVEHGLYRVVARVEGLCTANIPVKVEGSPLAHHKLIITMRPKDIDTCSYGTAKER